MSRTRAQLSVLVLALLAACGADDDTALSREELMKPETCKPCHLKHYEQWASSMHAYASKDPVFRAMNKRGQREAKLGEFCVNCHAPMAVREGVTTDGLNLDQVPDHLKGVTCYFCHNTVAIGHDHDNKGDHNNTLQLANDTTMRAGISDAVDPVAHKAEYSALHDGTALKSSSLCGGCHDIVTPNHGVHLERTFAEYSDSFYAHPDPLSAKTCSSCHMDVWETGVIANVPGVKGGRDLHSHLWPAVDVALTDFPNRAALKAAVEECELANSIQYFSFDPSPGPGAFGKFIATLETAAGHNQPSGAAHDRRMWLEFTAYDRDGKTVVAKSGHIADDAPETNPPGSSAPLHSFNDRIFDAMGKEVHMFWDADKSSAYPDGYDATRSLPVGKISSVQGTHSVSVELPLGVAIPGRVELRVRLRPMGFDVLQDLVDSGDLDAAVLKQVPTFTVISGVVEWNKDATSPADFTWRQTNTPDCQRYQCMIDPMLPACEKE